MVESMSARRSRKYCYSLFPVLPPVCCIQFRFPDYVQPFNSVSCSVSCLAILTYLAADKLKTLKMWQKENLLIMSNSSYCNTIFNIFIYRDCPWICLDVLKMVCRWERVSLLFLPSMSSSDNVIRLVVL